MDSFIRLTAGVVRFRRNLASAGTSNGIHCARTTWRPILLCHRNLPDESIFSLAAGSSQQSPLAIAAMSTPPVEDLLAAGWQIGADRDARNAEVDLLHMM
ncbi:hypothetical protein ABIC01_003055 [Bradyrhizobium sp. RT4b]